MIRTSIASLLTAGRYAAVTSAAFLEKDKVSLVSVRGEERLSRPFCYRVKVSSIRRVRRFASMPGQRLTVGFKLHGGGIRHIDGYVRSFEFVNIEGTRSPLYELDLVPWLSFLEYRVNTRIFQDKTSLEIAKEIFGEHRGATFVSKVRRQPPVRPYCVQYDESDLAFVSRLLEQDGIYYFFKHADNSHEMILVDGPSDHEPGPKKPIETHLNLPSYRFENDIFWEWHEQVQVAPGSVVLDDYNFEKPNAQLQSLSKVGEVSTGGMPTAPEQEAVTRPGTPGGGLKAEQTNADAGATQREVYHYPGRYQEAADGKYYARVMAEEIAARRYSANIKGSVREVTTGSTFQAANPHEITSQQLAPRPNLMRYMAVAVQMELTGDRIHDEDSADNSEWYYRSTVHAVPADTQYRPPCITPRPVAHGPETAIVVGRRGDEITTDRYGRIKVQFHWDRYGKNDQQSSCWIRVAQTWAGKGYGALITPRVGQEVVVDFLSGNPDRPLVVGAVYNAVNMPPENLPSDATRSTFMTRKERGTSRTYNDFVFEDRSGKEEVFLRAERDHHVAVGQNYTVDVTKLYTLRMPKLPKRLAEGPGEGVAATGVTGALPAAQMAPKMPELGAEIEVTPTSIKFSVMGTTGRNVIEITDKGIIIAGTSLDMLATKVMCFPPPLPRPSPEAAKALNPLAED